MEEAVTALFDEATNTVSYIVADPATADRRLRAGFQPEIRADLDMFGGLNRSAEPRRTSANGATSPSTRASGIDRRLGFTKIYRK